jgi:hypothetical protein
MYNILEVPKLIKSHVILNYSHAEICVMDTPAFEFGKVHLKLKGFQ